MMTPNEELTTAADQTAVKVRAGQGEAAAQSEKHETGPPCVDPHGSCLCSSSGAGVCVRECACMHVCVCKRSPGAKCSARIA